MAAAAGPPQDDRDDATTPLGSWPSQASAPPFAAAPGDTPTEPQVEPARPPTFEQPTSPFLPAYPDPSGPAGAPGPAFPVPGAEGAPGYPPPAYGYGAYGPYAYGAWAPPRNNGLAVAAMVCGICGFVFCQLCAIPALILGLRARRQIRESQGAEQGDAFALAGIVLGGLGIALLVGIIALYAVIIGVAATSGA